MALKNNENVSRWLNLEADLVCVYYIIIVCAVENSVGRYNKIIITLIITTCVITMILS